MYTISCLATVHRSTSSSPQAKVTMLSNSKSKRQKFEQQWQTNTRNWLELPADITSTILSRVGARDILENAQNVCTAWRKICKDPSMWRVLCMDPLFRKSISQDPAMCKLAVDRSQGQLIDITIGDFGDDKLIQYVADRSSQLKRLKIISCYSSFNGSWTEALKKLPLLEELSLYPIKISKEDVKAIGSYCPLLKTLKLNEGQSTFYVDYVAACDQIATTIGANLHELEHLELIGNSMSNIGLQVILDGCPHLKSLDLRMCWFIDLGGELGKRCSKQIKCLKRPYDPVEIGQYYIYGNGSKRLDDSDNEDDREFDYDDLDEMNHWILRYAGMADWNEF